MAKSRILTTKVSIGRDGFLDLDATNKTTNPQEHDEYLEQKLKAYAKRNFIELERTKDDVLEYITLRERFGRKMVLITRSI